MVYGSSARKNPGSRFPSDEHRTKNPMSQNKTFYSGKCTVGCQNLHKDLQRIIGTGFTASLELILPGSRGVVPKCYVLDHETWQISLTNHKLAQDLGKLAFNARAKTRAGWNRRFDRFTLGTCPCPSERDAGVAWTWGW